MDTPKHIDQEVEKTLGVLDELERVEGNPFLYSRLEAKLAAESQAVKKPFLAPALRWAAMLIILIVANIFTFTQLTPTDPQMTELAALASDYAWDSSTQSYYENWSE